jgi:hypothetical protein
MRSGLATRGDHRVQEICPWMRYVCLAQLVAKKRYLACRRDQDTQFPAMHGFEIFPRLLEIILYNKNKEMINKTKVSRRWSHGCQHQSDGLKVRPFLDRRQTPSVMDR